MKRIKYNITFLNTISSVILQFITILSGFIIPKLILSYFGSDVNGLISSLTQFLSYISLLEGGVTGVIMANLYKPLVEKDYKKISSIIKTTNNFYKKISYIFIIYSFIVAIIYPIMFKTNFSYIYVFSMTIVLSLSLFIQYSYSLSLRTLLNADKKVYIVFLTQTFILILTIILSVISIKIFPSVHVLKAISGLLFLIQPLIYNYFVKKYYIIDKKAKIDHNLLKSRWNGFAINIAAFIHSSTDVIILSLFTNLTIVSIYSVYSLVVNGLRQLISTIATAITPTIGHLYASNDKKLLHNKFDVYEFLIFFIVFLLHSVAILLIVPFVMIYTKNITDTDYYNPLFGILLLISESLYLIKLPHLNLSYSANKFKEITIPCYIEAIINIVVSFIFVRRLGLVGVAIGTLCAMLYRMIFQVYYTKKIIGRQQVNFYKKFIVFILTTLFGIMLCKFIIPIVEYKIISFIVSAVIYFCIMLFIYLGTSLIFWKKELFSLINILKNKDEVN